MAQPNWVKIKARYEKGGISHRELAAEEGVPYPTLRDRARREGWTVSAAKVRSEIVARTSQKIIERCSTDAADYVTQHLDDWQTIRTAIMAAIEAEPDPLEKAKMGAAVYKALEAVQKGQRLSLNLDKPEPEKQQEQAKAIVVVPPDSDDWQKLVEKRTQE